MGAGDSGLISNVCTAGSLTHDVCVDVDGDEASSLKMKPVSLVVMRRVVDAGLIYASIIGMVLIWCRRGSDVVHSCKCC